MANHDDGADAFAALTATAGVYGLLEARQALLATQKPNASPELFRLNPTNDLRRKFTDADSDGIRRFAGLTPMEYVPGRSVPAGHVMYAANSEVPLLADLRLEERDGNELIQGYDHSTFPARHLKLTITTYRAPVEGAQLAVETFRVTRASAVLKRTGKIAALFSGGVFNDVDDDILLFDATVDAISVGGATFFTNSHSFMLTFQFVRQMQEAAADTFKTVTRDMRINGLGALRAAATRDVNMMSKMASIQRKLNALPQYAEALKMSNLLNFIDSHPHVDIDLEGEGEERRFVFSNSPTRRYKILKLLDDDYLTSALTNLDYSVDSKGDPTG